MMEDEIEAVAALWHETWHGTHDLTVPRAICEFRTKEYFRHRVDKERDTVHVSGALGKPLGLCIVAKANLDMLFVASSERGRGIGEMLLADAEARMLENGVAEAYLYVDLKNHRAIRFYERHGWINAGKAEKEFQVAGGTTTNTVGKMTKPLRATIG
jgi:ribosomal protein S18 acetylase RimI-like enzyme